MDPIQISALIIIIAGAAIPVMCIIKMRMLKKFRDNAVMTDALVKASEKRRGAKGAVYYVLAIEYRDNNGRVLTGNTIGSKRNIVGSTMKLMYSKDDPSKYKTDFGQHLSRGLIIALIFFGLIVWFCWWLLNLSYTTNSVQ